MKIFVLGRPGCGKSQAISYIMELAKRKKFSAVRVNDYEILWKLFLEDKKQERFLPTEDREGFDVVDFSVLDVALKEAERSVKSYMWSKKVVVIEFARDDYNIALRQFSKAFLKDAYFLFIDTNMTTCMQRIRDRVKKNRRTNDDKFVSERILNSYYREQHFSRKLMYSYGIANTRIRTISNQGDLSSFKDKVYRFTNAVFEQDRPHSNFNAALQGISEKLVNAVGTLKTVPQPLVHHNAPNWLRTTLFARSTSYPGLLLPRVR